MQTLGRLQQHSMQQIPAQQEESARDLSFVSELDLSVREAISARKAESNLVTAESAKTMQSYNEASRRTEAALNNPFNDLISYFDEDTKSSAELFSEQRVLLQQLKQLDSFNDASDERFKTTMSGITSQLAIVKEKRQQRAASFGDPAKAAESVKKVSQAQQTFWTNKANNYDLKQLLTMYDDPNTEIPKGIMRDRILKLQLDEASLAKKSRDTTKDYIPNKAAALEATSWSELQKVVSTYKNSGGANDIANLHGYTFNVSEIVDYLPKREQRLEEGIGAFSFVDNIHAKAGVEIEGAKTAVGLYGTGSVPPQVLAENNELNKLSQVYSGLITQVQANPNVALTYEQKAGLAQTGQTVKTSANIVKLLAVEPIKNKFARKESRAAFDDKITSGVFTSHGAAHIVSELAFGGSSVPVVAGAPPLYQPLMKEFIDDFRAIQSQLFTLPPEIKLDSQNGKSTFGPEFLAAMLQKNASATLRKVPEEQPGFIMQKVLSEGDYHFKILGTAIGGLYQTVLPSFINEIQNKYGEHAATSLRDLFLLPDGRLKPELLRGNTSYGELLGHTTKAVFTDLEFLQKNLQESGQIPSDVDLAKELHAAATDEKAVKNSLNYFLYAGDYGWQAFVDSVYQGKSETYLVTELRRQVSDVLFDGDFLNRQRAQVEKDYREPEDDETEAGHD